MNDKAAFAALPPVFRDAALAVLEWRKNPPSKWSCPCGFTGGSRNIRQHRLNCFAWSCHCQMDRYRNVKSPSTGATE